MFLYKPTVTPSTSRGGPSAHMHLEKTWWEVVTPSLSLFSVAPSVSRGVSLWDAVPIEVRDASLPLGRTE